LKRLGDLSATVKGELNNRGIHTRHPNILKKAIMAELHNNKDKDSTAELLTSGWKRLLNYKSIVKQLPFFLFLTVLAVLYIYNGHYADKTIRNINKTSKEVKELQYEYKTVKSEVMFRSQESELARAVEPLGLKELTTTPAILKDSITN
jgi:hypothetical protein